MAQKSQPENVLLVDSSDQGLVSIHANMRKEVYPQEAYDVLHLWLKQHMTLRVIATETVCDGPWLVLLSVIVTGR